VVEPSFTLREASGRLYGRGACDMKGFDACVPAMALSLALRSSCGWRMLLGWGSNG